MEFEEGGETRSSSAQATTSRGEFLSTLDCLIGTDVPDFQPWTASATSRHQTDVEKAKKLELIRLLRNDLEKVRMLTERVRKREKKKLERVILLQKVVDELVFGKEVVFRDVLARVALYVPFPLPSLHEILTMFLVSTSTTYSPTPSRGSTCQTTTASSSSRWIGLRWPRSSTDTSISPPLISR